MKRSTRLVCALRAFPILGVQTNIPFLLRILEHPRFRSGEIDTAFLDNEGASLAARRVDAMPPLVRAVLERARNPRRLVASPQHLIARLSIPGRH